MGYTQGLRWQQAYDDLTDHVATTGGYPRPRAKVIGSRCRRDLVAWINEQRRLHRAGRLHPERVRQLEALPGWAWTSPRARPGPRVSVAGVVPGLESA